MTMLWRIKKGRLPFPNVETTIIPIVAEDPEIEFKLPQDPTKWDDLAVRYRKGKWFCFAKGGGLFPAAVASGAYRRSQVVVRYTDGTVTVANGSTNEMMSVEIDGRRVVLPPNGYFARAGDGSACVVSGAEWKGGGRLDISVAPDYVYLNAYGEKADTPFGGTNGRMYRLIGTDGTGEVFLCAGTAFALPYAAVSVTALDEAGKEIGPAPFTVENGRTRLAPVKKALSYRVAKPPTWREAPRPSQILL